MKFREVKLPSGAVLKIAAAPFSDSKALYQAVLEEVKEIDFSSKTEISRVLKDFLCAGLSSKKIEDCLWVCLARCVYNAGAPGSGDLKIDKDTFEPVAAREDYLTVCLEVAQENISPFAKSLYAAYQRTLAMIEKSPA